MGKIKIAYTLEVERKQLPNEPRTMTNIDNSTLYDLTHPNMAFHNRSPIQPGPSLLQEASYVSAYGNVNGNKSIAMSQNQFSPQVQLPSDIMDDDMDIFRGYQTQNVLLPCSFTLHSLSTMELTPISAFRKNAPSLKVFCDNFYQVTQVC